MLSIYSDKCLWPKKIYCGWDQTRNLLIWEKRASQQAYSSTVKSDQCSLLPLVEAEQFRDNHQ